MWFVLVDDSYQALYGQRRLRQRGEAPHFSDREVITLSLIGDTFFHGNEELTSFVRQHDPALFPRLLSNSRFNRRCALSTVIEALRRQWSDQLIEPEDDVRLIDSAPSRLHIWAQPRVRHRNVPIPVRPGRKPWLAW